MLLFLDCVWQVMQPFPAGFEFNERLLFHVNDALISGIYGTFLCNSERERYAEKLWERTESVWTPVLKQPKEFLNASYHRTNELLELSLAPRHIVLWEAMYYRWDTDSHSGKLSSNQSVDSSETTATTSGVTSVPDRQSRGDEFSTYSIMRGQVQDVNAITRVVLFLDTREAVAVFKNWIVMLHGATSELFSYAPIMSAAVDIIRRGDRHGRAIVYQTDTIPKGLRDILLYWDSATFKIEPKMDPRQHLGYATHSAEAEPMTQDSLVRLKRINHDT